MGILALAGLGYLFWRRRRNAKKAALVNTRHNDSYGQYTDNNTADNTAPVQEAPGSIPMVTDPKKGYWRGRQYEPAPQELPLTSPHVVHEMPTEGR